MEANRCEQTHDVCTNKHLRCTNPPHHRQQTCLVPYVFVYVVGLIVGWLSLARSLVRACCRFASIASASPHLVEAFPRPAMNLDIVSAVAEFPDADGMARGLRALSAAFGGLCRYDSGMEWTKQDAQAHDFVRSVAAGVLFTDPTLPTVGDMLRSADVQRAWDEYENNNNNSDNNDNVMAAGEAAPLSTTAAVSYTHLTLPTIYSV